MSLLSFYLNAPDMPEAACSDVGGEVFFPGAGDTVVTAQAKAICGGCPEREACLSYALGFAERGEPLHGIWGGLTASERRTLMNPVAKPCANGHARTPDMVSESGKCLQCMRDINARYRQRQKSVA